MRILFDSKQKQFKEPFGCVNVGQSCTLHIHIPTSVAATGVSCVVLSQDGAPYREFPLAFEKVLGAYDIWGGSFVLTEPALLFYYFRITGRTGTFRLFKQGYSDTNMEAGDTWQLTCLDPGFTTPDWAKGRDYLPGVPGPVL